MTGDNGLQDNQKGTTLMELIVAIGIFTVIMLIATGIFQSVIASQRRAIANQELQENLRFAFEVMSKELRSAQSYAEGNPCATTTATTPPGFFKTYNTESTETLPDTGSQIFFENDKGECVNYKIKDNRIAITRSVLSTGVALEQYITPDEIKISNLSFYINDDEADAFHSRQAQVTLRLEAEPTLLGGGVPKIITMQTSISSRSYE